MPDLAITSNVAPERAGNAISEELPFEGLGAIHDKHWSATLGGYTQQKFSQALGFPPGTKITIKNISKSITHTLNVVSKIAGPPAKFPKNPHLPLNRVGRQATERLRQRTHRLGFVGDGYARKGRHLSDRLSFSL